MNDVPQGWRDVEVRDVAELIRGVSYRGDEASKEPREGFVPLLRATNIADALLLDFDLTYVSRAVVAENQMLAPGDILIAASSGSRPVVGKSAPLRKHWDGTFGAFCAVCGHDRLSHDSWRIVSRQQTYESAGQTRRPVLISTTLSAITS